MSYGALHEELHELARPRPDTPPQPGGAEWHAWAEHQTVLKLRAALDARKAKKMPSGPPGLRLVPEPRRNTIRIHAENLKALKV